MTFRSGLMLMAAFGSLGAAAPKTAAKATTSNSKSSKQPASVAAPAEPAPEPVEAPVPPEWTTHPQQYVTRPDREFLAVGQAAAVEGAEDDARQRLGTMIAAWQERTLKCAQRESEKQKLSSKADIHHAKDGATVVSVESQHGVAVSLYKDELGERMEEETEGGKAFVQLRHSLSSMMDGIEKDEKRSADLREAVKACGEKTFDELAAPPAPTPEPKGKSKAKKK